MQKIKTWDFILNEVAVRINDQFILFEKKLSPKIISVCSFEQTMKLASVTAIVNKEI